MILSYDQLESLRDKKIAMVDGCFDPLHVGHLTYFETAKKLGFQLLCNVQPDQYLNDFKSRPTILPEDQRVRLIDSLKTVDYVHLCKTSTADVLDRLSPAAYIKGSDWKTRGLPVEQRDLCSKRGIEIIYLDTVLDSSTNLTQQFLSKVGRNLASKEIPNMKIGMNVDDFEKLVSTQGHVEAKHYTDEYFVGEWRDQGNDYSLETRRKVEGKNPQNIKEVFKPHRVLDLGCGPGALMTLLHEIGVETWGIDFSAPAKELASDAVRERIHVGSVTDFHDFGVKFDLVICRELLEHLTVLEIRRTVANMARLTEKFVYVTTRFHPNPESLLDVTDDLQTDSSHITVLNKDFLRTLFVLEGMKRRPDMEQALDWKNYGRVLVYEKIQGI